MKIVYRAYDTITEQMYYPNDAKYCVTMNGTVCDDETDDGGILESRDYRSIAMLSTGLNDKRGVMIWEGDIVLCDNRFQKVESIVFEDGRFSWGGTGLYTLIDGVDTHGLPAGNEAKVIGNIHQNKDLLDA